MKSRAIKQGVIVTLGLAFAMTKDAWYLNSKQYRDTSGQSGDEVGQEFDIVGVVNLPAKNQVQIGYGHFWPGEFAKNVTNSSKQADWIFVQWMVSL